MTLGGERYSSSGMSGVLRLPPLAIALNRPLIETTFHGTIYSGTKLVDEVRQWCSDSIGPVCCGYEEVFYDTRESGLVMSEYLFLLRFADVADLVAFRLRWA